MIANSVQGRALALALLIGLPGAAPAGMTAMERAIDAGAVKLTSDEIAELMVGKTVTWVAASGEKSALIHYAEDNSIEGRMIGGTWQGTGFYGVAGDDRICLSWNKRDAGRLRCLHVLMIDGTPHKFRADGSESGALVRIEDGRIL